LDLLDSPLLHALVHTAALAILTCAGVWLLVLTQRWHGRWSADSAAGVQRFHQGPTPRVGGLPIFVSLLICLGWQAHEHPQAVLGSPEVMGLLGGLVLAGFVAFFFGLLEDLTKRVGVITRLLATMASGVLAWWLTGVALSRVDLPGIDALLGWTPVAVVFTAFAVSGVANALNIVDGFNGLASSVALWAFAGLGAIAWSAGDTALATVCLLMMGAVLGFFVVNWPYGRVFLGDGGSYFLGFGLGWCSVLMIERNAGVTAFAALLVCGYPIIEVLFSAFRRFVRADSPGKPDRLHLHSLVKRRYVRHWLKGSPLWWRNSVTGIVMGAMTLPGVALGWWLQSNAWAAAAGFLLLAFLYVALYARIVRHHWCSPFTFLMQVPRRVRPTAAR
jgi:UDP-N-acetylmuramyl pentapeptide phosphotransferase/UDP-N-acetylglucosamine-1-phosphate transferase